MRCSNVSLPNVKNADFFLAFYSTFRFILLWLKHSTRYTRHNNNSFYNVHVSNTFSLRSSMIWFWTHLFANQAEKTGFKCILASSVVFDGSGCELMNPLIGISERCNYIVDVGISASSFQPTLTMGCVWARKYGPYYISWSNR